MNEFMKLFLSLSVSGALLMLLILGAKPLYQNKFSRRWQYYIWIIVALRFLLPFTPDTSIIGNLFEKFETETVINEIPASPNVSVSVNKSKANSGAEPVQTARNETPTAMAEPLKPHAPLFFHNLRTVSGALPVIWCFIALALFIRKITLYQGFTQYIKADSTDVSNPVILNLLSDCEEKLHMKTRVELSHHPLITSPIMIGFFHPRIVLPIHKPDDKELSYIFLHELVHCRQKDMFYKWLIQIVVCLHWFNPFVYLLEKEVNKSCELSCDETVLSMLDDKARRAYGDTLISFLKSENLYKNAYASVTLTEGAKQFKERLGAIMNYQRKNKRIQIVTGIMTLCFVSSAAFIGGYHTASASESADIVENAQANAETNAPLMETLELQGTTYYLVSDEAQLRAIGTGAYGMNQNYMQQADIQLSADEWTPIGTWENPFTGTYNGNGYEIIGLTMTDPDAEIAGLFGVARDGAQIYNITLRDCDITSAGRNASKLSAGAIVAITYGGRAYDNSVID